MAMGFLIHLDCSRCGKGYDRDKIHNLSACCGAPLLSRYDMEGIRDALHREDLPLRRPDMWRYAELLPVDGPEEIVSLGEGFTPLIRSKRLGGRAGLRNLWIKDESLNPTGSFKARGLSAAVSRAKILGATHLAIPSAGNAAGAMSAYTAAAGLEATVFMPRDVPEAFRIECVSLGARVELVDGLITDCGRRIAEQREAMGWFDVSTLKEPYRVEGKKTMGFELAEQMGWALPSVIVYPTGGGTGLIGMWKAFEEMERLGWIDEGRPRMVSVQAAGCAPIVRAFERGKEAAEEWENAHTMASGLRVPSAVGDFLMLRIIRQSEGIAISVTDQEMVAALREMGSATGLFPAPEGAAAWAGTKRLAAEGWIGEDDRVVVFNTGSGLKYIDVLSSHLN